MEGTKTLKREERERLVTLRDALPGGERASADAAILRRCRELDAWRNADVVLTYLSMGSEVDTHPLIRAAWGLGKTVALPYCVPHTRRMRWYAVDSLDGLVRSRFGVLQPDPDTFGEVEASGPGRLALVPALCFDRAGYRLGYGGGFYDTFLSSFEGVAVGLCRGAQLRDDLRGEGLVEAHDVPVGTVVTDAETIVPLA
jgi:5-formyltetrahydrofolate cyclo-ligase